MSTIDPGKLKVVELRAELTARGLDIKGNKPVLVQRLKEALEKESETVLPDTSIADTSTEDINATQDSINDEPDVLPKEDQNLTEETDADKTSAPPPERADNKSEPMEVSAEAEHENGDSQEQAMEEDLKSEENNESIKATTVVNSENNVAAEDKTVSEDQPVTEDSTSTETKAVPEDKSVKEQSKGEKRRRNSPSPQRVQRKRSRSPIKEDEPELDNEKVSLSWFDSDLNLQIDRQTLLSAKPMHEGAFGYSWAGARTTHGAKIGKVCYEVKITEELKWDDIIKQLDKKRESRRSERRDKRRQDRRGGRDDKKDQEAKKAETLPTSDSLEKPAGEQDTTTETSAVEPQQTKSATEATEAKENTESVVENETLNDDKKEQAPEAVITDENVMVVKEEVITDKPEADTLNEGDTKDVKPEEKTEPVDVKLEEKPEPVDVKPEEKPEPMEVEVPVQAPIATHVFRCGWSLSDTSLQLGETKNSYGFDSHGKFVNNKEFIDYGTQFSVGDVIGAYVNIDDEKVEFTFTVNGVSQGLAATIPRSEFPEQNFALFPHVLSRNLAFEINLGNHEEPWFPHPSDLSDYIFIQALEEKCQGPIRPASRSECEVIMMCGLPGSGKSHWVQEILKENVDKKYTVIGTSHLLEKMTINGEPLKNSYKNRWNIILDRLMKCANTLVDKAAVRRRNIIIDQTNVFPSAQRRKMRLFEGFKRRAVIVVVSDEEQTKRRGQQEAQEGKDVPDSALLEMKANMSLPKCGDWLEEVRYVELGEEEAKAVVRKYNSELKAAGFGNLNRRGGYGDNRGQPYRWNRTTSRRDYRDSYRDTRSYQNNRFRPSAGFQDRRPAPSNWNRDFRDSRGPPRDIRNRSGSGGRHDRPVPRDRNQSGGSYRNQRPQGVRSQPSNWQGSGGSWQGQTWGGNPGAQYQTWGQQNAWSGQTPWKGGGYGQGGYGQGGYSGNWNYYGQYANNWQAHK